MTLAAIVVPAALWAAFIFAMSTGAFSRRNSEAVVARLNAAFGLHLSEVFLGRTLTIVRSSAHFAEFFVLVWLVDRVLAKLTALSPLSSAACATAVAAVYGLLDEIHQRFVPFRSASPYDWGVDILGSALAGLWIVTRANRAVSPEPSLPRREVCS